jgi:uroporphyrinogen-III synthase
VSGPPAPLEGRTIVITRSEDRGETLSLRLRELGARVISVPVIRFGPPEDPGPLEEALAGLDRFRWILFTSATAVHFFFAAARARSLGPPSFASKRFGAVGPATASALSGLAVRAGRVACSASAEGLAAVLVGPAAREPLGSEDSCLLPQSDIARPELAERLREAGVPVTAVTAYRTLAEDPERAQPFLRALEGEEGIDGIAFASPSAVRSFLAMTHPHGEHAIREKPICVFSIGPTTSAAIRLRALQVAREASPHTAEALVEAIVLELTPEPPESGIIPDPVPDPAAEPPADGG